MLTTGRPAVFHRLAVILFASLICICTAARAQQQPQHQQTRQRQQQAAATKKSEPQGPKSKIRTITAFINLDPFQYQQQIADTLKMLKYARTVFESRGYQVETLRIATQPFPEYTKGWTRDQALEFFKNYDELSIKDGFKAAIGPAMLNPSAGPEEADLLEAILENTKNIYGSVVVAGEEGVRWKAVGAAARIVKDLSEHTEQGEGDIHFTAIAMVPSLTPFFPGAYHTGFGHQFTIGLESANVVAAAFQNAPDLATAKQHLVEMLGQDAFAIEAHADRIDRDEGWTYMGIDLSPAPLGDQSIGAAIETLTSKPVGFSGTLTAAATITAGLRDIAVKRAGYSGLMLPILEDSRLAQRWSEGRLSIDSLLSYSAVCGTGLDMVPLPGDVSMDQLALIIGDVASLAYKWNKPLSARLLPIPGKKAGDRTELHDPLFVNAVIQPLPKAEN